MDKMIIIKLEAGLGNQLFQYAAGKNLAYLNKTKLKFDTSLFDDKIELRNYELCFFNTDVTKANKKEIEIFTNKSLFQKLGIKEKKTKIKQQTFSFDNQIIREINTDTFINGYWQSEKYFPSIKENIRKEFTLKSENEFNNKFKELIELIASTNSVSLHIRRGDYINAKYTRDNFRNIYKEGYYNKAIEYIKNKVDNPLFIVFSDDIEWCKREFKTNNNFQFMTPNESHEDLVLMSLCKHNIIANSSFSWWGAWLNKNQNKIVIAPNEWYYNKWNTKNLMPEEWIKI